METFKKSYQSKIINIIPIAGKGLRFKKVGYKIHKSLIKHNKIPIFIHSAKCLPKANLNIFILKKRSSKEHLIQKKIIKRFFKSQVKIIILKNETKGQADTIYKTRNFIPKGSIVNIAASDTICKFDIKKYYKMIEVNEALIWTSKPKKFQIVNLRQFGSVIRRRKKIFVYCKKQIKFRPLNIITGFFSFKNNGKIFSILKFARQNKKYFINNEIYLDTIFEIFSKKYSDKINMFAINKIISFGTPEEYNENKIV
tara:strand:- start:29280 stop:30044 length:765 start_codon:yes stop_codon:yes gene_type:complete